MSREARIVKSLRASLLKIVSQVSLQRSADLCVARAASKACAALFTLFLMVVAVYAQSSPEGTLSDNTPPLVVEGVGSSDVFGWGQSVIVRGTLKRGVMAFGGDVIIEGTVEGDVASSAAHIAMARASRLETPRQQPSCSRVSNRNCATSCAIRRVCLRRNGRSLTSEAA